MWANMKSGWIGINLLNDDMMHAEMSSVSESTIIPYAKAWNLSFAEKLQARLPRELRDLIYRWMCADVGHLNALFTDFAALPTGRTTTVLGLS